MAGKNIRNYIPLDKSVLERSKEIVPWIKSWADSNQDSEWEILSAMDWFERGHDVIGGQKNEEGIWIPEHRKGNFIWAPPPAAAETALEQLRQARHKRQCSTHVFVCTRLMEPYWSRHLTRSADIVFYVPACVSFWNQDQHEPLIIGIYLPFLSFRPWQWKGTPYLLGLEGLLRKVWKQDEDAGRHLLRKFWSQARKLPSMPEVMASKMLGNGFSTEVSCRNAGKRRRSSVEETEGRAKIFKRPKG